MGGITYWLENPHALKAIAWSLCAVLLFCIYAAMFAVPRTLIFLGWHYVGRRERVAPPGDDPRAARLTA
jgi:hypothetical protein